MLRCSKADFEEVDFFRVETLTKRGRGRPKRVRIEEPDYIRDRIKPRPQSLSLILRRTSQ